MESVIVKVNQLINEKRERLKEKVEREFSCIFIPDTLSNKSDVRKEKAGKLPPISIILYGIAGLATVGVLTAESKAVFLMVSAASAFGGYKFSRKDEKHRSSLSSNQTCHGINDEYKTNLKSKVLDIVKDTSDDWNSFMELKQKEIQTVISLSECDATQKDEMLSKVSVYEVIDISVAEFSNMINSISDSSEISQKINAYKLRFLAAIENVAKCQIEKYNSLVYHNGNL